MGGLGNILERRLLIFRAFFYRSRFGAVDFSLILFYILW